MTVQGLDAKTIRQMVLGRLGMEAGPKLLNALAQPEHQALAGLARTPLLLTMLCEVYDAAGTLPRNRGHLLQQFVQQRWAWERERRPDQWIDSGLQEKALARVAYEMTQGAGRGTSVPISWVVDHVRAETPKLQPDALLQAAKNADVLELLSDGQYVRFTHQLVQEYFAAVALQKKLRQATAWKKLPIFGERIKDRELAAIARPGARTGWEETLLLLAKIEDDSGIARALIRSFVAQPLQAARLLEAEGASADPALRSEVVTEALRHIKAEPFDMRRRLDAGTALGILGDPVSNSAWQASISELSTTLTNTGNHYWRYIPEGRYRIDGWDEGQPAAEHQVAAFWMARLPITVAQFTYFVKEGYRDDANWTPHGLKWRGERTVPPRWRDSQYSGANQPVTYIIWYETTAFCSWLNRQFRAELPEVSSDTFFFPLMTTRTFLLRVVRTPAVVA